MVEHRHLQLHCLGEAVPHRRRRLHEEGTLLCENEHVSMLVSALRTLEEQPRADVAWLPHAAWVPLAPLAGETVVRRPSHPRHVPWRPCGTPP